MSKSWKVEVCGKKKKTDWGPILRLKQNQLENMAGIEYTHRWGESGDVVVVFSHLEPSLESSRYRLNPFPAGNPFLGTKLLGFSIGSGSGAVKGLTRRRNLVHGHRTGPQQLWSWKNTSNRKTTPAILVIYMQWAPRVESAPLG